MLQSSCFFPCSRSRDHVSSDFSELPTLSPYADKDSEEFERLSPSLLLTPPRPLPSQNLTENKSDIINEAIPESEAEPDAESTEDEVECSVVLGLPEKIKKRSVDPSIIHLKSSVTSLLEEMSDIELELHPKQDLKYFSLNSDQSSNPETVVSASGEIDTLNFVMSWLATEKKSLAWELSLMRENVGTIQRNLKDLEQAGAMASEVSPAEHDSRKDVVEQMWAEFLSISKELQKFEARVKVERKIRKRVEKYVARLNKKYGEEMIQQTGSHNQLRLKHPASFFTETNSLDCMESVYSEPRSILSASSKKYPILQSQEFLSQRSFVEKTSKSSLEIFGSDYVPLHFSEIIQGDNSESDQPKCFGGSSKPSIYNRVQSLHAALSRLGSKAEGMRAWIRGGSVIGPSDSLLLPHEELSDDDSDFESQFARAVVRKAVRDDALVVAKAFEAARENAPGDFGFKRSDVGVFGVDSGSDPDDAIRSIFRGIGTDAEFELNGADVDAVLRPTDQRRVHGIGRSRADGSQKSESSQFDVARRTESESFVHRSVFLDSGSTTPDDRKTADSVSATSSFSKATGIGKNRAREVDRVRISSIDWSGV